LADREFRESYQCSTSLSDKNSLRFGQGTREKTSNFKGVIFIVAWPQLPAQTQPLFGVRRFDVADHHRLLHFFLLFPGKLAGFS
jgi:hypothetical protein